MPTPVLSIVSSTATALTSSLAVSSGITPSFGAWNPAVMED